MTEDPDQPHEGIEKQFALTQTGVRQYRFEDLSQGDNRILVTIKNEPYELRLTKGGKLVLNK